METAKVTGRRVFLSGMLRSLGVSRSGYQPFLDYRSSESEQQEKRIKELITILYEQFNPDRPNAVLYTGIKKKLITITFLPFLNPGNAEWII